MILFLYTFFIALMFATAPFAAVNLNVNPLDGSSSLRFDQESSGLSRKKEIRVRVTSTGGARYQVFQRLVDPLTNEKGESLDTQAIVMEALSNSNTSGTLYTQNADRLALSEQLIYTSAAGGESDSFTIGYSLRPEFLKAGGHFTGRMAFFVRAVGEASTDQVLLNVFVDSSSSWKVSVRGSVTPTQIRLAETDVTQKSHNFVKAGFSGNSGEVRIFQETEVFPQNEMAQNLDPDIIRVVPFGDTEGVLSDGARLDKGRTLIYSSHKVEDNFVVYFLVNPEKILRQNAGDYIGKVKYIVESSGGQEHFPIDLQLRIQPIFTMDVTAPPGGVSFAHVLASQPPQEKEVLVKVHSNLHKPYNVLQNLQSAMVNEQGKEYDRKYFTLKVEIPEGQKGRTKFVDYSPVDSGQYAIFSSDAQGSPVVFKVIYRLQGYDRMTPGNFAAPVRFSLDQN